MDNMEMARANEDWTFVPDGNEVQVEGVKPKFELKICSSAIKEIDLIIKRGMTTAKFLLTPKHIIFNGDHTICIFADGTKTISWPTDDDDYSAEVGVAMCIMKRLYGSRTKFKQAVNKGYRQG